MSSENWAVIGQEGARVVFLEAQTHMTDRPGKHPISDREREGWGGEREREEWSY